MKICQICNYVAPASGPMGAERMIESLTKAFQELGHEVVMKLHPDSKNTIAPLVSEIPKDCDILHFHGWDPNTSEQEYNSCEKPWVVTLHGGGTESDPNWLKTVKNNPHIICVSKFIADRLNLKAYAWSCSEPDYFKYSSQKDNYFLWMAGTDWGESKGLFTTISLAKKLRFHLVIAGTGKNQNMIEKIKSLCDDKINFVGGVVGIAKKELISKAKGFIMMSQIPDACPLTISESLLSGTPIISSTYGCFPEVMNEEIGFMCKNDIDFAKAIINIKKIKPSDCYEYGLKYFSNHVIAKRYITFYKNMIEFGRVA